MRINQIIYPGHRQTTNIRLNNFSKQEVTHVSWKLLEEAHSEKEKLIQKFRQEHKKLPELMKRSYQGDAIEITTVSPKYQVTIPAIIRSQMNLSPGDTLMVTENNGIIRFIPMGDIKQMRGRYPGLSTEGLRDETERFEQKSSIFQSPKYKYHTRIATYEVVK